MLAGAIGTYRLKGVIQDLGKALGLPREQLKLLSKQGLSGDAALLGEDMRRLPDFRDIGTTAPGWRTLAELAPQLIGAPRSLGQHVGGMVLSSSPIPELVPVRAGAMDGRYIMDWNKDSVQDAGFAKIDILSLPVLDQIEEALDLIERRTGERPDMSRISPRDDAVYDMINEGRSEGRVPAPVPGAAQDSAATAFPQPARPCIPGGAHTTGRGHAGERGLTVHRPLPSRRTSGTTTTNWRSARWKRGWGIIVWQEQVVQLADGRGRDECGAGGRGAPRLRKAQQRASDSSALGAVLWPERKPMVFRKRWLRKDIQQGERALHVPGVPLVTLSA